MKSSKVINKIILSSLAFGVSFGVGMFASKGNIATSLITGGVGGAAGFAGSSLVANKKDQLEDEVREEQFQESPNSNADPEEVVEQFGTNLESDDLVDSAAEVGFPTQGLESNHETLEIDNLAEEVAISEADPENALVNDQVDVAEQFLSDPFSEESEIGEEIESFAEVEEELAPEVAALEEDPFSEESEIGEEIESFAEVEEELAPEVAALEEDPADALMDLVGESNELEGLDNLEADPADALMDLMGESNELEGLDNLEEDPADALMDLMGESNELEGIDNLVGINNDFAAFSSLKTSAPDDLTELLTNNLTAENLELENDLPNQNDNVSHFLEENKMMLENTDEDLALDELPDSVMNLIDHEGGSFSNFDDFEATELLVEEDSNNDDQLFDFDEALDLNNDGLNISELENVDQQLNALDSQMSEDSLDELQNLFGSMEESVEIKE